MNPQRLGIHHTLAVSSQSFSLFFFFWRSYSFWIQAGLAGDEKNGKENNQLSALWHDFVTGPMEGKTRPTNNQMSTMWQPEELESRAQKNSFRNETAVSLPRLWAAIYSKVNAVSSASFFFCKEASW